jgi:RNA polymerase sigma factor (sigma-70 family)
MGSDAMHAPATTHRYGARIIRTDDFDTFYRREFPRLAGSLRIVCGDAALAEELSQEAFTRALNHWRRVSEYDRPAGWVYRTGFNLLRRHWRDQSRDDDPLVTEPVVVDADSDRVDLVRLLGQLPYSQRQVVVMRHILDHSTDEVADVLDVSPGAVRMTLKRAMDTLRERSNFTIDEPEEDER